MQWGHIKTLFILSFLLLDIYLLTQFIDKAKEGDYGILDKQEATIEDQLQADNISITADLEMKLTEETYVLSSQKAFSKEEIERLKSLNNQIPTVISNNFIFSQFEEPISVPEDASKDEVNQLLFDKILFYDAYTFWDWNKDLNIMIFFQQQGNRPVYFNENGILLVYLNKDNEITHYSQTMMGEAESQGAGGTKTLYTPLEAIEILYNNKHLAPDEEVTEVGIGYYSRFTSEVEQVFAPTWKVTVNGERNYFVNAMEGFIFSSNDMAFLDETIGEIMMKLHGLSDENEVKKPFLNILEQMIQTDNRSEDE